MTSKTNLLTIGHSNHPLDRFLALLAQHEMEALRDIRRFPGSRKHPHFNRDNLASALQKSGVEYHWLEVLGGRRHKQQDESPNRGLHNAGFRNDADYMLTQEFQEGLARLQGSGVRSQGSGKPAGVRGQGSGVREDKGSSLLTPDP